MDLPEVEQLTQMVQEEPDREKYSVLSPET